MTPDEVLVFWFGELDARGHADTAHTRRWFQSDAAFDDAIRERFGALHAELASGRHADWRMDDRGLLASTVVLDQFSRNMFRGTAKAFATDSMALGLARTAVMTGADRRLRHAERMFVYMPYMHCEDLSAQDQCGALLEGWVQEGADDDVANTLRYARMHRDIVARFGRFPHRNKVLGRESTADEKAFLAQSNSSFGQG